MGCVLATLIAIHVFTVGAATARSRTSTLYADNIAIEQGRQQPVSFRLGKPMRLTDAFGIELSVSMIDNFGWVNKRPNSERLAIRVGREDENRFLVTQRFMSAVAELLTTGASEN